MVRTQNFDFGIGVRFPYVLRPICFLLYLQNTKCSITNTSNCEIRSIRSLSFKVKHETFNFEKMGQYHQRAQPITFFKQVIKQLLNISLVCEDRTYHGLIKIILVASNHSIRNYTNLVCENQVSYGNIARRSSKILLIFRCGFDSLYSRYF